MNMKILVSQLERHAELDRKIAALKERDADLTRAEQAMLTDSVPDEKQFEQLSRARLERDLIPGMIARFEREQHSIALVMEAEFRTELGKLRDRCRKAMDEARAKWLAVIRPWFPDDNRAQRFANANTPPRLLDFGKAMNTSDDLLVGAGRHSIVERSRALVTASQRIAAKMSAWRD